MKKELSEPFEIQYYFETKIVRKEFKKAFDGSPYMRLNHSQWLSHVIHSGGMGEAKQTFSFLFFQDKVHKEPIVIFNTSKVIVQELTGNYSSMKNNGSYYLKNFKKGAFGKTHATCLLSEFKLWWITFGSETMPFSIKRNIEQMFIMTNKASVSKITNFIGAHKSFIYEVFDSIGMDLAPEDMTRTMDFLRREYFQQHQGNFKEKLIGFLDRNIDGMIDRAIPYASSHVKDIYHSLPAGDLKEIAKAKWAMMTASPADTTVGIETGISGGVIANEVKDVFDLTKFIYNVGMKFFGLAVPELTITTGLLGVSSMEFLPEVSKGLSYFQKIPLIGSKINDIPFTAAHYTEKINNLGHEFMKVNGSRTTSALAYSQKAHAVSMYADDFEIKHDMSDLENIKKLHSIKKSYSYDRAKRDSEIIDRHLRKEAKRISNEIVNNSNSWLKQKVVKGTANALTLEATFAGVLNLPKNIYLQKAKEVGFNSELIQSTDSYLSVKIDKNQNKINEFERNIEKNEK